MRVYHWPENDDHVWSFDVPIATIPTEDFTVTTPDGADWLGPTSKVDWHIYGATQTGRQLWVAWNGARRVSGQQQNAFAYPQIGLALIDVDGGLLGQRFIWNANYGFAWPALATNANCDVGLAFCYAGEHDDPQYRVATLTGPEQSFRLVTSGASMGAGGHYIGVRRAYPDEMLFCAAGFNQPKPADGGDAVGHPHFTVFGP